MAIWPFFGLFWKLKKIVYFKACFGQICAKLSLFYNIFKYVFLVLANFLQKFGLYLAFFHFFGFGLFWNRLWPNLAFFIFLDLVTLIELDFSSGIYLHNLWIGFRGQTSKRFALKNSLQMSGIVTGWLLEDNSFEKNSGVNLGDILRDILLIHYIKVDRV